MDGLRTALEGIVGSYARYPISAIGYSVCVKQRICMDLLIPAASLRFMGVILAKSVRICSVLRFNFMAKASAI